MQDDSVMFPQPSPDERAPLPRYHLPTPLTPLLGREQEVTAACTLLQDPEIRLLTLTGTGVSAKRAWRYRLPFTCGSTLLMACASSHWPQ